MRFLLKMADAVGVLAVGVFAAGVAWVVARLYGKITGIWAWCIGYPVLGVAGVLVWHSEKWPHDVIDAFAGVIASAVLGATFFGIDLMIGSGEAPNAPIQYAVWHSGGPFGIMLTICVCPGTTLVALGGTVRELLLAKRQPVAPASGKFVFLKVGK
jgi:hypothetical protein